MMACWKQNDFNDTACAEEIRMFYDCVAKAEVIKASFVFFKASSRAGGSPQDSALLLSVDPNLGHFFWFLPVFNL